MGDNLSNTHENKMDDIRNYHHQVINVHIQENLSLVQNNDNIIKSDFQNSNIYVQFTKNNSRIINQPSFKFKEQTDPSSIGIIPTGPSYIKQINGELVKIVELRQNKLDPNEIYKPYPISMAILAFIINIFLPGIGTILGAHSMSTASFRKQYSYKGIFEFITCFCIIGWFLGIYDGVILILASNEKQSVEEYILDSY